MGYWVQNLCVAYGVLGSKFGATYDPALTFHPELQQSYQKYEQNRPNYRDEALNVP